MVVVVMGVTGCGKTTVGRILAEQLGWQFFDADDFHPPENVEKMRQGIPLDDTDRTPWLDNLRTVLEKEYRSGVVLACSALKRRYRQMLSPAHISVNFAFLNGPYELIDQRLKARTGHYMNPALLKSQFDSLEEPTEDERAVRIDVGRAPEEIARQIRCALIPE